MKRLILMITALTLALALGGCGWSNGGGQKTGDTTSNAPEATMKADPATAAPGGTISVTLTVPKTESGNIAVFKTSDPDCEISPVAQAPVFIDGTVLVRVTCPTAGVYTITATEGQYTASIAVEFKTQSSSSSNPTAPITTGNSATDAVFWDISQGTGTAKLTAHFPSTVTDGTPVNFSATPAASLSVTTATVDKGVATTVLSGVGVYTVTATTGTVKTSAKTTMLQGTSVTGSVTVSTSANAWNKTISNGGTVTDWNNSTYTGNWAFGVSANQNAVVIEMIDYLAGVFLNFYDTSGNFINSVQISASPAEYPALHPRMPIDTDGTNFYLGNAGGVITKYDGSGHKITQSQTLPLEVNNIKCAGGYVYVAMNKLIIAYNSSLVEQWRYTVSDFTDFTVADYIYIASPGGVLTKLTTAGSLVYKKNITSNIIDYISATPEGIYISSYEPVTPYVFHTTKLDVSTGGAVWDKVGSDSFVPYATQTGIFALPRNWATWGASIKKYDYAGNLVWDNYLPISTISVNSLSIVNNQIYYAGELATIHSTNPFNETNTAQFGRVNDIY